jgi:SAM-dependent methyltransferase
VAKVWYPIINYVPVLLAFRIPLHETFAIQYAKVLDHFLEYAPPPRNPMPGECGVMTTFTEQWEGLGDDDLTFVYDKDELLRLHRDVFLRWDETDASRPQSILNVGCGFGREAQVLRRISPHAQVVGIDLNLSLLKAGPVFADDPQLHLIVCSLFALPFRDGAFDHVHSQGVIHHTFDTYRAFHAIESKTAVTGSLFVWVYGREDAFSERGLKGVLRILYYLAISIFHPILARMTPVVRAGVTRALAFLLHPIFRANWGGGKCWRFKNTLHSVRDAFTPPYIHYHGFHEVAEWFETAGFDIRPPNAAAYRALMGHAIRGVGFIGQRRSSCQASKGAVAE